MFAPLPDKPDHDALEREILELWERERTFAALREKNAGGPRFSFIDGPVTANRDVLGVHTAWGRTLKDVFQRYKALRGYHQRYQNGFDCQGLWIEVGVERALGLNSKREIEEYGLAEFARRCREVVVKSSRELTEGSIRLGQWMDWGNDYFTFSDTNIEYIWRFLQIVHERGWLYLGHRSTEWCPRCGTSISPHELRRRASTRTAATRRSTSASRCSTGRASRSSSGRPRRGRCRRTSPRPSSPTPTTGSARTATGSPVARYPDEPSTSASGARSSSGCATRARSTTLGPGGEVDHRVIPWDEVSLEEGTGIVHIAPGAGPEDFELGRVHDLPVLTPGRRGGAVLPRVRLAARPLDRSRRPTRSSGDLAERGFLRRGGHVPAPLPALLALRHAADLAHHRRLVHLGRRDPPAAARRERDGRVDARLHGQAHGRLAAQHGRLEHLAAPLLRPAAALLPVRVRPPQRDRVAGGARGARDWRGSTGSRSSGGRGSTTIRIRCDACGEEVERIAEVGDVWLDAGIVPFSTLGWENPEYIPEGYATGAAKGLTRADLPDHAYWEEWFPADWVSEMREQIRLWFYSQLFMSVALTGQAPFRKVLGYEKMLDEQGREMHSSWGNMIDAPDAFARMGADVMRWQYCAQPPDRNLLFGFGPAQEIKRKLLTLWNSVTSSCSYANIDGLRADAATTSRPAPAASSQPLDRWLVERTRQLVEESTDAYER